MPVSLCRNKKKLYILTLSDRGLQMKDVMLWLGAGQIGMAIARRVGFNQKIIVGDKNVDNANNIAKIMREAGFDIESVEHLKTTEFPNQVYELGKRL